MSFSVDQGIPASSSGRGNTAGAVAPRASKLQCTEPTREAYAGISPITHLPRRESALTSGRPVVGVDAEIGRAWTIPLDRWVSARAIRPQDIT